MCRLGDSCFAVTCTDKPPRRRRLFPVAGRVPREVLRGRPFPGGYFKREARPSEKEILTARITDRPIRPLFPEGYRNDVQVNNMVLSADGENETDILSVNAASAALHISDIPFRDRSVVCAVGRINGEFVINPRIPPQRERP